MDRQTYRTAISISCISVLMRDKNASNAHLVNANISAELEMWQKYYI